MHLSPHFHNTVAVLFGGRSSEHEISLRSAVYILKNIPEKYHIIPVGISREGDYKSLTGVLSKKDFQEITVEHLAQIIAGKVPSQFSHSTANVESIFLPSRKEQLVSSKQSSTWRVLNMEAFCVFPVLHGPNGEDGRLQGLLELAEIAYVGCDIRSSVVGIDKHIQKRLACAEGISIAKYETVDLEELENNAQAVCSRIENKIGYPCFVKPNSMGSAVGTNKVKNKAELLQSLKEATAFDQKALVEELLSGTEIECAFLGSAISPRITIAGEIVPKEFYSYEEKYGAQSQTEQYIPARLSAEKMKEVQALALRIAKAMNISGFSRIDFWKISKTEEFVFNEYNTIPGLTSISMFPKLWEYEGVSSATWIEELIHKAHQRKNILNRAQFGIKAEV